MRLEVNPFKNSDTCEGVAYAASDAPLDIASIVINGRYPETGWAMNELSHEIVYVQRGLGKLELKDGSVTELNAGDAVHVAPNQWFAWEGDMTIIMACQPPFNSEQYKVEE